MINSTNQDTIWLMVVLFPYSFHEEMLKIKKKRWLNHNSSTLVW